MFDKVFKILITYTYFGICFMWLLSLKIWQTLEMWVNDMTQRNQNCIHEKIKLWEFLLLLNTISFAFPSAVQDHVDSNI